MCQGRSLQAIDRTWRGRRQLGAHAFSTVHVKAELRDAAANRSGGTSE